MHSADKLKTNYEIHLKIMNLFEKAAFSGDERVAVLSRVIFTVDVHAGNGKKNFPYCMDAISTIEKLMNRYKRKIEKKGKQNE